MQEEKYSKALSAIRGFLARFMPGDPVYDQIVVYRDEVLARYRPIFSPEHIPSLTREEFTSFLYFKNNHHWSNLYRSGLRAAEDMDTLKQALSVLLDENRVIQERFTEALDMVKGVGKAIATAILTVAYPDRYGVWNNTSEKALDQVGLWPAFETGFTIGERYKQINRLLVRLSRDLDIDLWTLDGLWGFLKDSETSFRDTTWGDPPKVQSGRGFILGQQLRGFLLENWDKTPLAQKWDIYSIKDEPEVGCQFSADVGHIDILAIDKSRKRFLVVELMHSQNTDQMAGQTLRHIGWVKQHLATEGQDVEALIIAPRHDEKLHYTLLTLNNNVSMMTYQVDFHLKDFQPLTQPTPTAG